MDFIKPEELSKRLNEDDGSSILVVDVRGADYKEGHVPGAIHIPSEEFASKLGDLTNLVTTRQYKNVVIHCMQSQVRGPSCARLLMDYATTEFKEKSKISVLEGGFLAWSTTFKISNPEMIESSD